MTKTKRVHDLVFFNFHQQNLIKMGDTDQEGTSKTDVNEPQNPPAKRKHEDAFPQLNNRFIYDVMQALEHCRRGDEISCVLKVLQPSRNDLVNHFMVVKTDLEFLLSKMLNQFEVVIFGSVISGLAFRDSDMDFYIRIPASQHMPASSYIHRLLRIIENFGFFGQTEAITGAKVPILKMVHMKTKVACDVNFTCPQGYYNSCFLNFMMNYDERIHFLAVIIKYWVSLNRHHLEQKQLNSYCIITMLLYYLQQLRTPIVPAVAYLQEGVPPVKYGPWNFAFNRAIVTLNQNQMSTFELLEGFFRFYARFDYGRNVICVYHGRVYDRGFFAANKFNSRLMFDFQNYVFAIEQMRCQRLQAHTPLCVQDPFEQNNNVGKSCLRKTLKAWVELNKFAVTLFDEYRDRSRASLLVKLFTRSPPVAGSGSEETANGTQSNKRARVTI
jgi:DNA polymerase sigma